MKKSQKPMEHLALIPDGNRRWAKENKLRAFMGHSVGIKRFIEFATWSKEFGIKTVTVWALSGENLKNRTKTELRVLFDLYTNAARDGTILEMLRNNKTRLRVIGDMSALPARLRTALRDLERKTREYHSCTINMLINYSGRDDLLFAASKLKASGVRQISPELVQKNLMTAELPEVDMVVRTSGEQRTSGFLPWQSSYSELYFAKKYWPDFKKRDFLKAMSEFARRQRRFGK